MGQNPGESLADAWERADANQAARNEERGSGRGNSDEEFEKKRKELASVHVLTDEELEARK